MQYTNILVTSCVHWVKPSLARAIFFLVAFPVWPQGGSLHCKVIFLSPPETETDIRVENLCFIVDVSQAKEKGNFLPP